MEIYFKKWKLGIQFSWHIWIPGILSPPPFPWPCPQTDHLPGFDVFRKASEVSDPYFWDPGDQFTVPVSEGNEKELIHGTQLKWHWWPGWQPWEFQGAVLIFHQHSPKKPVCIHLFKMSQHGLWLAGRAARPLNWLPLLLHTCCLSHNSERAGTDSNWCLYYDWHCWSSKWILSYRNQWSLLPEGCQ